MMIIMAARPEIAHLASGEIVIADVLHPLENPHDKGKRRPVVLIRRQASGWYVAGLTTNSRFANGRPRTPVPNPDAVGLQRTTYLWGQRPTLISVLDIHNHVGWADAALLQAVILECRLGAGESAALVGSLTRDTAA